MNESDAVRQHVLDLLRSSHAHVDLETAVKDLPANKRGVKPQGAEHSAWEILEHIRIAQWDILEFSRDAKHVSPKWPGGYWPKTGAPPSAAAWTKSLRDYRADLAEVEKLVKSKKTDLFAKIPHGTGQTILREALLIADHTAYHVGELVLLRRILGAWK